MCLQRTHQDNNSKEKKPTCLEAALFFTKTGVDKVQ